jgi:hypothetical protein
MRYLLIALALCTASCVTGSQPVPEDVALVDPTGNWSMVLTWRAGTCGLTGTITAAIAVSHDASGYVLTDASSDVHAHGTVTCSDLMCQMSFTESGPGPAGSVIQSAAMSAELAVDATDAIIGTGGVTYQFTNSTTCAQQFSVAGVLR